MLRDNESDDSGARSGPASWVLWIVGWGLLVGCVAAVLPAFAFFGPRPALWAGGVVVVLVSLVAWLGAEAEQTLSNERRRTQASLPEFQTHKRVTTIH